MPHVEAQTPKKFHSTIFYTGFFVFFIYLFFFPFLFSTIVDLGPFGNSLKWSILGKPFS